MPKSEINKLSKRQILESLYYEQNQSSVTLTRLVTAIARLQNVKPEDLAKAFAEAEANQEFVQKFNDALKSQQIPENAKIGNAPIEDLSPMDEENKA